MATPPEGSVSLATSRRYRSNVSIMLSCSRFGCDVGHITLRGPSCTLRKDRPEDLTAIPDRSLPQFHHISW